MNLKELEKLMSKLVIVEREEDSDYSCGRDCGDCGCHDCSSQGCRNDTVVN